MELSNIIFLVISLLLLIGIGLAYYFKKDYLSYSKLITPILVALLEVLKAVGGLFPNETALNTLIVVISSAIKAAGNAEDLWLKGEIDKDKRPDHAANYIYDTLKDANITITDNILAIINGVIAITCYLMPHHDTEKKEEEI